LIARPFTLDDAAGVNALHAQIHWPVPSAAQWEWLAAHPAHRGGQPIGWVIDNNGRIDGFIGCQRRHVFHRRQRLILGSIHSVIVAPYARGSTRTLLDTVAAEPDLAATVILNANRIGSPVYSHRGYAPLAGPSHDVRISWILAPTITLMSRLMRQSLERWPGMVNVFGERFSPRASTLFNPRLIHWPKGVHLIEDLSDNSAYGQFWRDLLAEPRMVSDRSPALMRWFCQQPDRMRPPLMLGYHDDRGLAAYALAQISKTGPVDVAVLEILDMVALDRAPDTALPALIKAIKTAAYKMEAAKVRLPVVNAELMRRLGSLARSAHREGAWGHGFIKAGDAALFDSWSPTAFDGSDGFTLRQPPAPRMAGSRTPPPENSPD